MACQVLLETNLNSFLLPCRVIGVLGVFHLPLQLHFLPCSAAERLISMDCAYLAPLSSGSPLCSANGRPWEETRGQEERGWGVYPPVPSLWGSGVAMEAFPYPQAGGDSLLEP